MATAFHLVSHSPEALGAIAAAVYMITLFLYVPVQYGHSVLRSEWGGAVVERVQERPQGEFVELICALLSICCMVFLGFADDVLNLKWRSVLPTAPHPVCVCHRNCDDGDDDDGGGDSGGCAHTHSQPTSSSFSSMLCLPVILIRQTQAVVANGGVAASPCVLLCELRIYNDRRADPASSVRRCHARSRWVPTLPSSHCRAWPTCSQVLSASINQRAVWLL